MMTDAELKRLNTVETELKELRGQFLALLAFLTEDEDPAVDEAAKWQQAHDKAMARRKRDRRDA